MEVTNDFVSFCIFEVSKTYSRHHILQQSIGCLNRVKQSCILLQCAEITGLKFSREKFLYMYLDPVLTT